MTTPAPPDRAHDSVDLLSVHGSLLRWVAREPSLHPWEYAARLGVSVSDVRQCLADLTAAGAIRLVIGTSFARYTIDLGTELPDPVGDIWTVGRLLTLLGDLD